VICAVHRTAPIINSFVQFSELHLSAVVNFSLAILTKICDRFSAPHSGVTFCCGIPTGVLSTKPIQNAVGLSAVIAPYAMHCDAA